MAKVTFTGIVVTIITAENTKHTFNSVSAAVMWCRNNGVEACMS